MLFQGSVFCSAPFIQILTTLVFCARRLFSHFISPLLDTCFNSWYLSDLLLFIPSLFSRAWPLTLILLHAVFHTLSPSLPVSLSPSLLDAYIYLSRCLSFFLPYLLLQGSGCHISCISSLMGYQETLCNTPASLFCQSHQVPNFISTLPTSNVWLFFFLTETSVSI